MCTIMYRPSRVYYRWPKHSIVYDRNANILPGKKVRRPDNGRKKYQLCGAHKVSSRNYLPPDVLKKIKPPNAIE